MVKNQNEMIKLHGQVSSEIDLGRMGLKIGFLIKIFSTIYFIENMKRYTGLRCSYTE